MKHVKRWLKDIFAPENFNDLDVFSISDAFNDSTIRGIWISDVLAELKRINLEVDNRLLTDSVYGLTDLCARRKAIQELLLDGILSAKRRLMQDVRPNPKVSGKPVVDLDRVTA